MRRSQKHGVGRRRRTQEATHACKAMGIVLSYLGVGTLVLVELVVEVYLFDIGQDRNGPSEFVRQYVGPRHQLRGAFVVVNREADLL